jgi:hypothetical protein
VNRVRANGRSLWWLGVSGVKTRNISSLRNDENELLFKPFRAEIILEFFAQVADLHPNDIVLIRVKIRTATQDITANIVFADAAWAILQGPARKIQKDLPKLRGFLEVPAGQDALNKRPAFIFNRDNPMYAVRGRFAQTAVPPGKCRLYT